MLSFNIHQRLALLEAGVGDSPSLTLHQQHLLEQIDCDGASASRQAEKRCRKLAMGDLEFSPS